MPMDDDRIARLPEGQKQCLRMVLRHMSSKQIALALGISPHTVDQRLRQAMRTLGASSRVEAARALAEVEGAEGYQPLAYQSPHIESPAGAPSARPSSNGGGRDERLQRIGWIVAIVAAAAAFFAAVFTGLNALSEFTR
jgi:DNA-binding CsgD family transcriptional regulator